MSGAASIATVVSVAGFMLGAVIAIVVFIGGSLGARMDRLDGRFDQAEGRFEHLERRFESVESVVQGLREDVAVLKATR